MSKALPAIPWGRIWLSSFSAGYGAVREILKDPTQFKRIEAIVAADSIYASLEEDLPGRRPRGTQMRDFRRFATLAAAGQRTFVVTHSAVETPYASTVDTANDLLRVVGIEREQVEEGRPLPLQLVTQARRGNFYVFGYAGDQGEDHLEHLRQIGRWWSCFGSRREVADGWRLEVGGWRLEAGGWRLETGGWRPEAGVCCDFAS